jgi:hypothetical protein
LRQIPGAAESDITSQGYRAANQKMNLRHISGRSVDREVQYVTLLIDFREFKY